MWSLQAPVAAPLCTPSRLLHPTAALAAPCCLRALARAHGGLGRQRCAALLPAPVLLLLLLLLPLAIPELLLGLQVEGIRQEARAFRVRCTAGAPAVGLQCVFSCGARVEIKREPV